MKQMTPRESPSNSGFVIVLPEAADEGGILN
jgi:hypothetical protein